MVSNFFYFGNLIDGIDEKRKELTSLIFAKSYDSPAISKVFFWHFLQTISALQIFECLLFGNWTFIRDKRITKYENLWFLLNLMIYLSIERIIVMIFFPTLKIVKLEFFWILVIFVPPVVYYNFYSFLLHPNRTSNGYSSIWVKNQSFKVQFIMTS